jgi:chemotaxis protein MotB
VGLLVVSACGGPTEEAYQAALDRSQALLTRNQELELEAARRALADVGRADAGSPGDQQARLAELRRRAEEQAARIADLRTFVRAVRSALGQRGIEVTIRYGRMLVTIPEAVLFDTGQADLKGDSREVLGQMAHLMRQTKRSFRVTGHTDNVPISNRRFRSNWALSTARAVEVVHFLIGRGVAPEKLAAAGRAENEPAGDNATAAGRSANRRIELVLEADLAEVVELGAALFTEKLPAP